MKHTIPAFRRTLLAGAALLLSAQAIGQTTDTATAPASASADQQTVVVLGSRSAAKTALDTAAPVGLINMKDMQNAGPLELGKLLQTLDPSFNFSSTFISDGTDIIRPATLRSLGPDQLLVLINGKRRHQQALVNVQQTVGRGSAGTDINAIPLSSIHHIEVLRDGAAAQYGSDAIAGVINIVLKSNINETQLSGQLGTTSEGDGDNYSGSVNRGWALGTDGGFINVSAEARKRKETNRAGLDTARTNPPRVTQRIGDSDAKDLYLWLNAALPTGNGGELYAFGGASKRKGDSSGFFRAAEDARTVPDVYKDGYLPNIRTTVKDASLAVGFRKDLPYDWKADVSVNHGRSELDFHEKNTINVSYWYEPKPGGGIYAESPLEADTGKLKFDQTTFNLDFKGPLTLGGANLFFATGFEWREDNYQIVAGDPVSYQYGRNNSSVPNIFDRFGGIAASGTQGFPGYTPATEVDAGRHNISLYGDLEYRPTEQLLLAGAVRYEKYSDFGNTTTGKITARWDPTKQVGIRGSYSSGFRAPGVQQAFYSSVSTNLDAKGVLTETLTARQDSAVTRALGIAPLKEETSRNASVGIVLRPVQNFSFTADVYQIKIKDRIVFSSNISESINGPVVGNVLNPLKVGQAQFFTNAVDTTTRGLDIVTDYKMPLPDATLVLSAQLGFNKTEVTGRHSTSSILSGEELFDASQVTLIEHGQPRRHHVLSADYTRGQWNANARANYYGAVQGQGFTPGFIQTWDAKWIADLTLRYSFTKKASVAFGVNNVFDTYPTEWDKTRAAPFPQLGFTRCWETCPFGINGRSMYVRADYAF